MKLSFFLVALATTVVVADELDDLPDILGAYSQNTVVALARLDTFIQNGMAGINDILGCGISVLLGAIEQNFGSKDGSACPAADTAIAKKLVDLRSMTGVAEVEISADYFQDDKTRLTVVSDADVFVACGNVTKSLRSLLTLLQHKSCQFRLSATSLTASSIALFFVTYNDLLNQLGFPYSTPYLTIDLSTQYAIIRADVAKFEQMSKETSSGPSLLTCVELAFGHKIVQRHVHKSPPASAEDIVAQHFLVPTGDVSSVSKTGTVAAGRFEHRTVRIGDDENLGVPLRGTKRGIVNGNQVLTLPRSIMPYTKFEAEVYILTKEEGGRSTPFFNWYRPQVYLHTSELPAMIELPDEIEMVLPGKNVNIRFTVIDTVTLEDGQRFVVRDGGRTVGAGVVTRVVG